MIEIREIDPSEHAAGITALGMSSVEELRVFSDLMSPNPSLPQYEALHKNGLMLTLGAFDGDKIVGFSINIISVAMHYAGTNLAQVDFIYLHKDYRSGRNGLKLIRATEDAARARGANILVFGAKEGTSLISLLPKLGYTISEVAFCKEL